MPTLHGHVLAGPPSVAAFLVLLACSPEPRGTVSGTADASVIDPAISRLLDVPYRTQQTQSTCGPSSLSMVLSYHGVDRPESTIASDLSAVPFGVSRTALRDYVDENVPGFTAEILTGWAMLEQELAAGHPVIAQIGINASDSTQEASWPIAADATSVAMSYDGGHFVVVVGWVRDAQGAIVEVVCNDPANWRDAYGDRVHYTAESFDAAWDDDYGTTRDRHLIAVRPSP